MINDGTSTSSAILGFNSGSRTISAKTHRIPPAIILQATGCPGNMGNKMLNNRPIAIDIVKWSTAPTKSPARLNSLNCSGVMV
jgi:hypothetical protein